MREIYYQVTAEPALAQEIVSLLARGYGVSPWTAAQVEQDLKSPHTCYILAWAGADLVGLLAAQVMDLELEITQILVEEDFRKQGLARGLLSHLPGDRDWFLEVRASNHGAQAFYSKQGFVEIARRKAYYHDPIEDALIMKREKRDG